MDARIEMILNLAQEAVRKSDDDVAESAFPLQALPRKMRRIAMALRQHENFEPQFLVPCMLSAIATCVGSSHLLKVSAERMEPAILFVCIVARKGAGKSAPLRFAYKHLKHLDSKLRQESDEELREYHKLMMMPQKQREDALGGSDIPPHPKSRRILVSDTTQEAVTMMLSHNPHGICLYMDELEGWVKNFTRYNRSSSEEQFWLQLFNGSLILSDRKDLTNSYSLSHPCINVVGGIHPPLLSKFAAGDRIHNGFIDRIMFIYVEKAKAQRMSATTLPDEIGKEWEDINMKLIDLFVKPGTDGSQPPSILCLSPGAKAEYLRWNHRNADMQDDEEDDDIAGMYAKLDYYVLRLSLVLQMARWACGEAGKDVVDAESVKSAIAIAEYMRQVGIRVRELITNTGLDEKKAKWLSQLPPSFSTKDAVSMAERLGVSRATAFRYLADSSLFVKREHGVYEKRKRLHPSASNETIETLRQKGE